MAQGSITRSTIRSSADDPRPYAAHKRRRSGRCSATERVEKARRVLGLTPTPIEDAFRATYAWYLTQPRRSMDYAFEDELLGRVRR